MAPYCSEVSEHFAGGKEMGATGRFQPLGFRSAVRSVALPRPEGAAGLHSRPEAPVESPAPPGLLKEEITTLMLRNVPRGYTEEALVLELEAQVGKLSFDFIYLPWDNSRHSNNGHAFVNLVNSSLASALTEKFNGQRWRFARSQKTVGVRVANVQGISANLAHYVESLASRESRPSQPWVLRGGACLSLIDALAAFCPPEVFESYLEICSARSGSTAVAGATAPLEPSKFAETVGIQPLGPRKAVAFREPHGFPLSPQGRETRRETDGASAVTRKLTVQCLDELFEDSHAEHVRHMPGWASAPNAQFDCSGVRYMPGGASAPNAQFDCSDGVFLCRLSV